MTILGDSSLAQDGLLQVLGQDLTVISKLPWSDVKITLHLGIGKGKYVVTTNKQPFNGYADKQEYDVLYEFSNSSLSVIYNDILITFSPTAKTITTNDVSASIDFHLLFNFTNVNYIEDLRQHDITFVFRVAGNYTTIRLKCWERARRLGRSSFPGRQQMQ